MLSFLCNEMPPFSMSCCLPVDCSTALVQQWQFRWNPHDTVRMLSLESAVALDGQAHLQTPVCHYFGILGYWSTGFQGRARVQPL